MARPVDPESQNGFRESLRLFASSVTSSKVSTHRKAFTALIDNLSKEDHSEIQGPVVKGILKLLITPALYRYQQKESRRLARQLILHLVDKHTESAVSALSELLTQIFSRFTENISDGTAKCGLASLKWLCFSTRKLENTDVSEECLKSFSPRICTRIVWHLPKDNEKVLPLLGYLVEFGKSSPTTWFVELEPLALDLYVKFVLSSKTTPSIHVILVSGTGFDQHRRNEDSCRPIVRLVSHDKFESVILPAAKKSMLRNPEVALRAVAIMVQQIAIELSKYGLEVLKLISSQLYSKDNSLAEKAVEAVSGLCAQCSDWEVVSSMLKHLFSVLNVNEGILCAALAALTAWSKRFKNRVPPTLIACFKEGLTSKKISSQMRFEYLLCVNNSLNTNTLSSAVDLSKILITNMEAGIKQSSQTALLTESVVSALILLKLCRIAPEIETKMDMFWIGVTDKKVFANRKFLASLSDEGMDCLSELFTRLILEHSYKLPSGGFPADICKTLLLALIWPKHTVRRRAEERSEKLLDLLEGARFAQSMLRAMEDECGWIAEIVEEIRAKSTVGEEEEKRNLEKDLSVIRTLLQRAFVTVCKFRTLPHEDGCRETALAALIPSILPVVNPGGEASLWVDVLHRLQLDPEQFVRDNIEDLCGRVRATSQIKVEESAVFALSQISSDSVWKELLEPEIQRIPSAEIGKVSEQDAAIALTPEGNLYDTSVIEKAAEDTTGKMGNIKRESKAYSYKEQKMEMELRKELEEKKRKEGKDKKELTPKQKQAHKDQLEKEATIRKQVFEVCDPVKKTLRLVKMGLEGNLEAGKFRLPIVLEKLLPLSACSVLAPDVVNCWLTMRKVAFPCDSEKIFGLTVANCTMRLLKSAGGVEFAWTQEPLSAQARRCVQGLYEMTYGTENQRHSVESSEYEDEAEMEEELSRRTPLSLITFGYSIPLLKSVLCDQPGLFSEKKEETWMMALKLIKIQMNPDNVEGEELSLVPMERVSGMLIQLISSSDPGSIQQLASSSLLSVADVVNKYWMKIGFETEPLIQSLLSSLLHPDDIVREYSLKGIGKLGDCIADGQRKKFALEEAVERRVWVGKFDRNPDCRNLASELWDELDLELKEETCEEILGDAMRKDECIREAAAESLKEALTIHENQIRHILNRMGKLYEKKAEIPPPVFDEVGRMISDGTRDDWWEERAGLALGLKQICPLIPKDSVKSFFEILVPHGINDRRVDVRDLMLQAAVEGVKDHGGEHVNVLLEMFENLLDEVPDGRSYDILRQSLVVLLGTLARHLDPEKSTEKIRVIVARLIETLSTPSQQVQESVAQCLPPLIQSVKDQAEPLSEQLLHLLLEAEQYGERRGAAYGIAGLVKGMGMVSMKKLEIMSTLQEALADKKVARHREGALFALEMLCTMLGKLFDPYVVTILPNLLISLGDHDQHVRKAAEDCAKAVMKQLSAHGVKLVLPSLLAALEEDSWRTKCGSIELLGAMAYCAPKQLSSCLPSIVPKLIDVLSDTHIRVQKAGEQALKQIGQVIRNQEIQAISGVLLSALMDPANKTAACLQTLLKTKFVHYIDAPSLALLMPVIRRAFDDRSTETRRMAAQIIGNIFSLTDQKDVEPYLDQLLPGLKKSLTDPVPEVRAVSARALGAIVESAAGDVAQNLRHDILRWLKEKLVAEQNPVDRSGAAQGLSEVFGALGSDQLPRIMPDIIATAESDDVAPHVKDGYIMLYIYLPGVFKEEFLPYLSRVIPSVLKALADENEFVRETPLRAGQRLINMYCETAIPLLIPQLERGLFDDNWRIRFSSVQLVGDFLFKISGVTGKMTTSSAGEDDTFGTETSSRLITNSLGTDERNRVFSGLYIARSDVALVVRQAAGHVWKVVVSNTPRTLKEILPTLFSLLLGCLASSSDDKQQTAARCLGDLVKKMGDRVLVDVVPVLEEGLRSDKADQRQGVCVALSQIMLNTTKDMITMYMDNLVPTVRTALYDPLAEVREAAAATFDVLHSTIGTQALDEVLTPLLEQLSDPKHGENTLHGLQKVMAVKSRVVLPYLIPKLTAPPVNTKALSQLAAVSGEALGRHMSTVLESMLTSLANAISQQTEDETEQMQRCLDVVLSVSDDQGISAVLECLLRKSAAENRVVALAAVRLLAEFCQKTKVLLGDYAGRLMEGFIGLYASQEPGMVEASVIGLTSVVKNLDSREQLDYVFTVKQAVRSVAAQLQPGENLPGFCIAKGLQPILPILREGVLNGGPELKEGAAEALGEVIQLSDPSALKPHVVNVTGPLIRVLGDRFSPGVKTTILNTLALFLEKVEMMLKPFLPQLQSTFLKALQDPGSRSVRLSAGRALSKLILIHPKPDTIVGEILKNAKNMEDSAIRETFLVALRGVVEGGKERFSQDSKNQTVEFLLAEINSVDDSCRQAAGAALGALVAASIGDEDQFVSVVNDSLLDADLNIDWEKRHGQSVGLQVALKLNPDKFQWISEDKLRKALLTYIAADRVPVSGAGLRGAGFLLGNQAKKGVSVDSQLLTAVARAVNHQSNEIKHLAGIVAQHLAAAMGNSADMPFLKIVVPMMVNGTKEKNSGVRCCCEEALVVLFNLRTNQDLYNTYCNSVDPGAKQALIDVYQKSLMKLARQPTSTLTPLDDTVQI